LETLPTPVRIQSQIYHRLKARDNLNWANEQVIANYFELVLTDIAAAFKLHVAVSAQMQWDRKKPDLWLVSFRGAFVMPRRHHELLRYLGIPIGVVEVKCPLPEKHRGPKVMDNPDYHGQLFDYMMQLREYEVRM